MSSEMFPPSVEQPLPDSLNTDQFHYRKDIDNIVAKLKLESLKICFSFFSFSSPSLSLLFSCFVSFLLCITKIDFKINQIKRINHNKKVLIELVLQR